MNGPILRKTDEGGRTTGDKMERERGKKYGRGDLGAVLSADLRAHHLKSIARSASHTVRVVLPVCSWLVCKYPEYVTLRHAAETAIDHSAWECLGVLGSVALGFLNAICVYGINCTISIIPTQYHSRVAYQWCEPPTSSMGKTATVWHRLDVDVNKYQLCHTSIARRTHEWSSGAPIRKGLYHCREPVPEASGTQTHNPRPPTAGRDTRFGGMGGGPIIFHFCSPLRPNRAGPPACI